VDTTLGAGGALRAHDRASGGITLRASRFRQGLRRLTTWGFPRRFPIVQFPNAPLIVAFLTGRASQYLHGIDHDYFLSASHVAMTIWAYEELRHGVNWFRHLLGFAYLIIVVMRIAHALHT
jgi:hypothetical protein